MPVARRGAVAGVLAGLPGELNPGAPVAAALVPLSLASFELVDLAGVEWSAPIVFRNGKVEKK
eukprot:NODE_7900_length_380_cov_657.794562_g6190_i0.p4 GENE.NODE_7900_length_380_cov_657.794562_g6190_i0~~NODE_7900_length_380_cov_657.794562_g6190_i0.p4  ORF type:complete len:63 (+),score=12.40 NODE_7900_length_380_cov_657.794562_g6190_i0:156-344(+)